MSAVGVLLALLAAACFGVGAALQKRRAVVLPAPDGSPLTYARGFFGDGRWLAASGLVVAGWGFEFAALARAPVALVLPTALSGVVLVAALSSRWFGERLTGREWLGVAICVAGVVAAGVPLGEGVPVIEARLDATALGIAVGALLVAALATLAFARHERAAELCLAGGAGLLYAATGCLTKALAIASTAPRSTTALLVLGPSLAILCVAAVLVLQRAFQRGRATVAVAVSGAVSSFLPAALGSAVFGETWPDGAEGVLRWAALGAMLLGFALLIGPATRLQAPTTAEAQGRESRSLGC